MNNRFIFIYYSKYFSTYNDLYISELIKEERK